jgi:hypothetical protein
VKRFALVMLAAVVFLGGCAQAILPGDPGGAGGPGLTALTVTPSGASIPGVAQQQFTAKTWRWVEAGGELVDQRNCGRKCGFRDH